MEKTKRIVDKLKTYKFEDEHGHDLMGCMDFMELVVLASKGEEVNNKAMHKAFKEITGEKIVSPELAAIDIFKRNKIMQENCNHNLKFEDHFIKCTLCNKMFTRDNAIEHLELIK